MNKDLEDLHDDTQRIKDRQINSDLKYQSVNQLIMKANKDFEESDDIIT
jgi:hypothetical protein